MFNYFVSYSEYWNKNLICGKIDGRKIDAMMFFIMFMSIKVKFFIYAVWLIDMDSDRERGDLDCVFEKRRVWLDREKCRVDKPSKISKFIDYCKPWG